MTLIHGQAISAQEIESALSREQTPQRFASMCNAIAWLTAGHPLESVPSFTERTSVKDKGIDAELTLKMPSDSSSASPYLGPGLNILQFKQRDVFAQGRAKTVAHLKSNLKGALKELTKQISGCPDRYVVFTNIDLSHQEKRALTKAIRHGHTPTRQTHVEIVGAAELAAAMNSIPHVRSGYFATASFSSWQEAQRRHTEAKVFGGAVTLVGRDEDTRAVKALIDDPDIRAIVLTGPHNIGKSRLALEATGHRFLEVVVSLGGRATTPSDLASLIAPGRKTLVLIDDPDPRALEQLVTYVLGSPGITLIATIPLAEGTPDPNFGRDHRVQVRPVGPLSASASHDLLRAAGGRFDFAIEAWIVDQAGGNPGILLAAAKAGAELRKTPTDFTENVARIFAKRVERELGANALEALEVLSLLTHVGIAGEPGKELALASTLFGGGGLDAKAILRLLPRLQESGVLKVTGLFAETTPPLFANHLARAGIEGREVELMQLFAGLTSVGRHRLLRRLQSVKGEAAERFWKKLSATNGPLHDLSSALENPHLFRAVATAAPDRAARIIEEGLHRKTRQELQHIDQEARRELRWVLDELLFRQQTSIQALRAFARLAEAENERYDNNATGVFGEAFHWDHPQLPITLEDRLLILRECTADGASQELKLVSVKAIDRGLSRDVSVMLRRGAGSVPLDPRGKMTWGEVWDYVDALFGELLILARSADDVVAKAALAALPAALQTLGSQGRLATAVPRMKQIVGWALEEGLPMSVAKLTGALRFVRSELAESEKRPNTPDLDVVRAAMQAIDVLLGQLEGGGFGIRLQRWAGPWSWGDHEEDDQRRKGRERRDIELETLAQEAVGDPSLLTPDLRAWLISLEAQYGHRFFWWLGRADTDRRWIETLEDWGKQPAGGGGPLAAYLGGVAAIDPQFATRKLDQLTNAGEVNGRILVSATSYLPADEVALRRIETLLRNERVDPGFTATALSGGRWVDPFTDQQFLRLLQAIAGPHITHAVPVVDLLGMWRHLGRAVEGPLADFAWRCLESAPPVTPNDIHDFDQLAHALVNTDPARGFRLLETLLTQPRERQSWRPTDRYQERTFWATLKESDRERAIRLVFEVAGRAPNVRLEVMWDLRESLDQLRDAEILTALAMKNEKQAELVTDALTSAKPGFWPIALKIAQTYPRQKRILSNLEMGIERTGVVSHDSQSAELERSRAEVRAVLDHEAVPARVREWLLKLEASLATRAKRQLIAEAADDVNELRRVVENPSAPERLWAIRSLVTTKHTSILHELIPPQELRKLMPKLRLAPRDRERLRRQFGLIKRSSPAQRRRDGQKGTGGRAAAD